MRVKTALDWNPISSQLRAQMQAAPQRCRKDLARMIGRIEGLVHRLGSEEVELRRLRKDASPRQQELLADINQSITDYEQWLVVAYLQHG
jgi:uncharacterized protein with von Willebrand factor type A (vWA) domain